MCMCACALSRQGQPLHLARAAGAHGARSGEPELLARVPDATNGEFFEEWKDNFRSLEWVAVPDLDDDGITDVAFLF